MTRYTIRNLRAQIAKYNDDLAQMNHEYRFVVEQFNDATWLAIATPEQIASHVTQERIEGGSPRKCVNRAVRYMSYVHRAARAAL